MLHSPLLAAPKSKITPLLSLKEGHKDIVWLLVCFYKANCQCCVNKIAIALTTK